MASNIAYVVTTNMQHDVRMDNSNYVYLNMPIDTNQIIFQLNANLLLVDANDCFYYCTYRLNNVLLSLLLYSIYLLRYLRGSLLMEFVFMKELLLYLKNGTGTSVQYRIA